jgi:tetratricopeptide (TPR) repeat protein
MTTAMPVTVRCALCGASSNQNILTSTSSFGSPDLDLRPNGPARWSLQFSVQRCPRCGYCAERIGERTRGAERAVSSIVYRDILDNARMPELARHYFCAALVAEAGAYREISAQHFISAAWACDDAGAGEQARLCRDRAAETLAAAIEWGDVSSGSAVVHGVRADLLRRAGRFDDAIEALEAAAATLGADSQEDEGTATVLAFIRELAEVGDAAAHCVAEAFAAGE